MLNPSTADATLEDPTIRKCVGFAERWHFRRLVVVNLFALRATDPDKLDDAEDPVGEMNLFRVGQTLVTEGKKGQVIYAWGAQPARRLAKAASVAKLLRRAEDLYCHNPMALALTNKGWPAHPLYRSYTDVPQHFTWPKF